MITTVYEDESNFRYQFLSWIRYHWEMRTRGRTRDPLTLFGWLRDSKAYPNSALKCSPVFSLPDSLEGSQREGAPCKLLIGRFTSALASRLTTIHDRKLLPPKMLIFSDHPVPARVAHLPGIQLQRESLRQEEFIVLVANILAIAEQEQRKSTQTPETIVKPDVLRGRSAILLWHQGSRGGMFAEMLQQFLTLIGINVTLCYGRGAALVAARETRHDLLISHFEFHGGSVERLLPELLAAQALPKGIIVIGRNHTEQERAINAGATTFLGDPIYLSDLRESMVAVVRKF